MVICALLLLQLLVLCGTERHSSENWSNENQHSNDRIIQGAEAIIIVPYLVSMQRNGSHFCGGSIISEMFVVTAAHCVEKFSPGNWTVRVGSLSKLTGDVYDIVEAYQHPEYNISVLINDLAVIAVHRPFVFEPSLVEPIRVSRDYLLEEVDVFTAGWGRTQYDPPIRPNELQILYQETINNDMCGLLWGKMIQETQFCSVNISRTCQGDSGGPVVTLQRKEPELVGVVSWGPEGCASALPNVRTRLSSYLDFIDTFLNSTTNRTEAS